MRVCRNCGVSIEHKIGKAISCSRKCYGEMYRNNNREKRANYQAKWRRDNKEGIAKYYQDNKAKLAKHMAKWSKGNLEKRQAHWEKRRSKKLSLPSDFTIEQWKQKLEEHNYRCSYCYTHQDDLDMPLEQEHIVPVSNNGGYTWDNIVPACQSCNASKGNKSLLEYLTYRRDVFTTQSMNPITHIFIYHKERS